MDNINNCFDPSFSHLEIDQDHECLKQFLLDQDKSVSHPPLHQSRYDSLSYNMLHPNNNMMQDSFRNRLESSQLHGQNYSNENSTFMGDSYGGYTVLTPNPSPMAFNYNPQTLGSNFNQMDTSSSSSLQLPGFDPCPLPNQVENLFTSTATTGPSTMLDFTNRQVRNDQYSPGISPTIASFPTPVSISDSPSAGVLAASPMCNGESSSLSDSVISPATTQRTGSERSIETNPRSIESLSSDLYSPRVDLESLIIQPQVISPVINGESTRATTVSPVAPTSKLPIVIPNGVTLTKSGKPRKRRSAPKEKILKPKKQPAGTIYHSEIAPAENGGIKLKISLTSMPQKKKRKSRKKSDENKSMHPDEPITQSPWGDQLPNEILYKVFQLVTSTEGCIPFLARVSRVCKQWRAVASDPLLWTNIDLAGRWISKNPIRNDINFRWLCENRLANVEELNLGGWQFTGIPVILDKISTSCLKLKSLSLTGWEGLTMDNVRFLVTNFHNLERIDLSGINAQHSCGKSGVCLNSLLFLTQYMGSRLTHLNLADNRLSGIGQIVNSLATYCPNLQSLDLTNVRMVGNTGHLHIEQLQEGCPKLRVLRMATSQLCLSATSLKEQGLSSGFPLLEELSVATISNDLNASGQPFIDDHALERILKTSHKLCLLDVRGCSRVTEYLVRVPAWDLTHLYLSGCCVTRINDSGLDLICKKWSHSLMEIDLSWSTNTTTLDAAVMALAEQGKSSLLRKMDLTGSSISLEPVKAILNSCPLLNSLNLASCRGLPRGIKRLYKGHALAELRIQLNDKHDSSQESEGG
ncbi:F-box/LRR-repeat protein 6 [Daktulosphaira vitifoliae]|uniref:F-box/LRR-repeat protein 6 n=1 Tax=Daktulosphaira vitifoliae TaxID=58002 RepID=UPI0021A98D2C|nr:F-box/LRR-repeat protein 6 [Daktulosphaira vitifoliae]XP_050548898.1 F-box/LRR-repeat protein 6 [Daktulosphaira vitifoliae]